MQPEYIEIKLALENILGLVHSMMGKGTNYSEALDHMTEDFMKRFKLEDVLWNIYHRTEKQHQGIRSILSMLKAYSTWYAEDNWYKEMERLGCPAEKRKEACNNLRDFFGLLRMNHYWAALLDTGGVMNELKCYMYWISQGYLQFTDEGVKNIYEDRRQANPDW